MVVNRVLFKVGELALDVIKQDACHIHGQTAAYHNAGDRDMRALTGEREGGELPASHAKPVREIIEIIGKLASFLDIPANSGNVLFRVTCRDEFKRPEFGDFFV